jgi:hypothetical protein
MGLVFSRIVSRIAAQLAKLANEQPYRQESRQYGEIGHCNSVDVGVVSRWL